MAIITFNDKVTLDPQPSVARENKVIDDDMNQLKNGINGLGGVLLWTNPNPTDASGFTGQEINVDLSGYDMIEILFNEAFNMTKVHSTGKVPKLDSTLQTHFNGVLWDRNYAFSNNKITFGNGHKYNTYNSSTLTDNNGACIPYYIIGYKTGLF